MSEGDKVADYKGYGQIYRAVKVQKKAVKNTKHPRHLRVLRGAKRRYVQAFTRGDGGGRGQLRRAAPEGRSSAQEPQ